MPLFRKQTALVLLVTIFLVFGGLYATFCSMKEILLWPENDFFALQVKEGNLSVQALGLHVNIGLEGLPCLPGQAKESIKNAFVGLKSSAGRIYYLLKEAMVAIYSRNNG